MSEIKLIIEAPAIAEALNRIAEVMEKPLKATMDMVGDIPSVNVSVGNDDEAPKTVSETVVSTETVAPEVSTASEAPVEHTYSVPSIEEIGSAGAALIELGKTQDLINLLSRYGLQSIVQLNGKEPDVVMSFVSDLKALGATF